MPGRCPAWLPLRWLRWAMNFRKGLFRIWIVASVIWIVFEFTHLGNYWYENHLFRPEADVDFIIVLVISLFTPPLAFLLTYWVAVWIARGFRTTPL